MKKGLCKHCYKCNTAVIIPTVKVQHNNVYIYFCTMKCYSKVISPRG